MTGELVECGGRDEDGPDDAPLTVDYLHPAIDAAVGNLVDERLERLIPRDEAASDAVYWILGIGFVLGMAAYVGGYALRSSVTTEPLRFVGDLLYTLGWALWTGVVVVVFLQVLPDAKRRQYRQALDAYEAALRDKALAEGDASGNDEASTSA